MDIVAIHESNHGLVGIAKDTISAIDFLIVNDWLTEDTELYCEMDKAWVSVLNYFGEAWKNAVYRMPAAEFNELFWDVFDLEPMFVYEKE